MPELPTHLYLGRSSFAGPVIGGYTHVTLGPVDVTTSQTNIVPIGFIAPCELRLERIAFYARAVGAGVATCNFYKDTADFVVGSGGTETRLHTTADISAEATTGSYIEAASGGLDTLVASARNIAKGDRVYVAVTTDGTGSLTDFSVCWSFVVIGHINADSAKD